jgi:hypothetical protein
MKWIHYERRCGAGHDRLCAPVPIVHVHMCIYKCIYTNMYFSHTYIRTYGHTNTYTYLHVKYVLDRPLCEQENTHGKIAIISTTKLNAKFTVSANRTQSAIIKPRTKRTFTLPAYVREFSSRYQHLSIATTGCALLWSVSDPLIS